MLIFTLDIENDRRAVETSFSFTRNFYREYSYKHSQIRQRKNVNVVARTEMFFLSLLLLTIAGFQILLKDFDHKILFVLIEKCS